MNPHITKPEVEELMCELYAPLLWKALDYPNGEARANATALFINSFPLVPKILAKIEAEKLLGERCSKLIV